VTERALQSAFKAYLGKTPSELIQDSRLERARTDMQDGTGMAISAAEVGKRWGISRRSKLLSTLAE
jgi:AraC-like DNA-binding protein